jgi:hypothetical protein
VSLKRKVGSADAQVTEASSIPLSLWQNDEGHFVWLGGPLDDLGGPLPTATSQDAAWAVLNVWKLKYHHVKIINEWRESLSDLLKAILQQSGQPLSTSEVLAKLTENYIDVSQYVKEYSSPAAEIERALESLASPQVKKSVSPGGANKFQWIYKPARAR